MALGFGKAKDEDVVSLIAAKKYGRAIEILKAQLQKRGASPSLRMQLADVLLLADKATEAVAMLLPLADQYAREGFAAKAVSVLKKIQKVEPGRRDVEERLARLIQEKQREAVLPYMRTPEIGIEEIGMEPPAPEIAEPPIPAPPPAKTWRAPKPPTLPATPSSAPAPAPAPVEGELEAIEDYDLLYSGNAGEEAEIDVELTEPADEPAGEPMSDGRFTEELMSLVDSVFQEPAAESPAGPVPAAGAPRSGSQIVVSPLFRDFSVDEMVAVIEGLKLLAFERGAAILREGQPGGSLYMLTSGRVRAFRKDAGSGKQVQIGDLTEGAFFGEMSILTGKPRMASIVALTRCELLELDRPTLDGITQTHPHVWDVLREFAVQRARAVRD